jgi:predicted kinase
MENSLATIEVLGSPLNPPQVGDSESNSSISKFPILGDLGGRSRPNRSEKSHACLISTDAIRAQLFGDEAIQGSWLKIWLEVRSQFQQAATAIAANEIEFAIYDATNAVRKQRRSAISLARKSGFTYITGVWVNPTIEICLERNRKRSRQVPEEVIHRMARRLYGAPPSFEEGLDEVVTIS